MKAKEQYDRIPDQQEGSKIDVEESRNFETIQDATAFFELACRRLLNINLWGKISGLSSFQLFDEHGNEVDREGRQGDYIRIDIPGPGTQLGGGFDWVRIEEIFHHHDDQEELLSIRVRPSVKPMTEGNSPAHFLKAEATSTFIVRRLQLLVQAEEHGRNEMANTDTTHILDNARNLLVGGAAKLGLSYPQWKLLVKGIMASV
ncbi:hypothetical protein [Pedobacter sp. R20-19]|uniref:hypothetical protein n=1 Tax=Pedobacter sp. R20-19 TaxID=1270196 RepID=UPI000492F3D6|nr:hypothetical protein [Pedobacter sp. R20-19]